MHNMKRIYIDMDGVLADFISAYNRDLLIEPRQPYPQSKYGFFATLEPIEGAVAALKELQKSFDVWILTRPSIQNLHCYSEKAFWLRQYFGEELLYKTVICPDKSIVKGDYLIDDQTEFGQTEFEGKLVLFGSAEFPDWKSVLTFFETQKKSSVTRALS